MSPEKKLENKQKEAARMILETVDFSIALSIEKGCHPLTKGCNCIVCVTKRKRIIKGDMPAWRYRL